MDDAFGFSLVDKLVPQNLTELSTSRISAEKGPMQVHELGLRLPRLRVFVILDVLANTDFLTKWFVPAKKLPFARYGLQLHITPRITDPGRPRWFGYSLKQLMFPKHIGKSAVIYGTEVRHVVIIGPDSMPFRIDDIHDPALGMAKLQILLVRAPIGAYRGYWNTTLEYKHARHGRLALPIPNPKAGGKLRAERYARLLSKQNLQNLRFVVIHNEYFWIEHFNVNGHYTRVWKLEDALEDYWQRVKMKFLLNDEDWAFLRDQTGIVGPYMSDGEYRRGNRLAIFREMGGFQDAGWEHDTKIGFPPTTIQVHPKHVDSLRKVLSKRKRDVDAEIEAGYFMKVPKPDHSPW